MPLRTFQNLQHRCHSQTKCTGGFVIPESKVQQTLKAILREWKDLERKVLKLKIWKRISSNWTWPCHRFRRNLISASRTQATSRTRWLYRLTDVARETRSKGLIDSLEIVNKVVAYLADAAVETVRTTAKSVALLILARRAIWVKS